MKIRVTRPVELEVSFIRVIVPVRYGTEDMPKDYPHRKGDVWDIVIAIDNGEIQDWPKGVEPLELHMKVVDEGHYILFNHAMESVGLELLGDYVPGFFPDKHYGDYLILDIDAGGKITNWNADAAAVAAAFAKEEE